MATSAPFDVVKTYNDILAGDSEITMPVAAIEALIMGIANTSSSTVFETLDVVRQNTEQLKAHIPNAISLSAGTDLFQKYLFTTLNNPNAGTDFADIRADLVEHGREIVVRAKAARDEIAKLGKRFIRDGDVVLTQGGSRVVGAMLKNTAEPARGAARSCRFSVIYVVGGPEATTAEQSESAANIAALRSRGVPVATIPPTAVAYCINQVTLCLVGAEGVVEDGGVISRLGTYQMAILAKHFKKPFYVVAETHKFVRLYPMGQSDLGIEQKIIDFKVAPGLEEKDDEGVADMDGGAAKEAAYAKTEDAVDFTPPEFIAAIVTETGVYKPSAVSEELIKMWF